MAIIGTNDTTGMTENLQTSSSSKKLTQHATYLYQAGASEEVFRLAIYVGTPEVGDGNGVDIGVYDLGTGPTVEGADLIASGQIASLSTNTWNTLDITPVALTSGHYYGVAMRVRSATNIDTRRVALTNGTKTVGTGASALLDPWTGGADSSFLYAMYAETQASGGGSTITDVDTDETLVAGQTTVQVTGTDLDTGTAARIISGGRSIPMTNYSASATSPTFDVPNLAALLAAGIKFGSVTLEIVT